MSLPPVKFQQALIRVDAEYPRSAPAGQAFRAEFTISNLTPQLQQLSVVVGDASGFVIAGKLPELKLEMIAELPSIGMVKLVCTNHEFLSQ